MKKAIVSATLIVFAVLIYVLDYYLGLFLIVPSVKPEQQISFALYTVSDTTSSESQDKTLKMSVQLYPLNNKQSREIKLEVANPADNPDKQKQWKTVAQTTIDDSDYDSPFGGKLWLANFRVENWDHSKNISYRVNYQDTAYYQGIIRKDPVDKENIVVAAFTGNSNRDRGPKHDIIASIKQQDPDLLFFSGDQSYDHFYHLYAWLLFGKQFGEITKDRPTVILSDDHDVGQLNLWGAEGISTWSPGGIQGGYLMSAQYVNAVEKAQTSHMPDPYDSTPIKQGIGVYYTSLNIGGVDFAIIEDRKFKSAPDLSNEAISQTGLVKNLDYNTNSLDDPDLKLLGDRQLLFLQNWAADWHDSSMKAVLSATIFANAAHIHGGEMFGRVKADLDSNGWPQTGRNKALREIRKAFAPMIAGDQHLATVSQQGIDAFTDSGFAFSVPSIGNYYPRRWEPLEESELQISPELEHTGNFLDGFNNKLTMHAYANPEKNNSDGAGYGLVTFNKHSRAIIMQCFQRQLDYDPAQGEIKPIQFPGWPVEHHQEENYGRWAEAWLPTIEVSGLKNPIIQVINEANEEIIYTLRIAGQVWRPKVFSHGTYTIKIGDQMGKEKVLTGLKALKASEQSQLLVAF